MKILKKLFRKKLHYTKEMQEQDTLWECGKEDLKLMYLLKENILAEAKKRGWDGLYLNYEYDGDEVLTDVYATKEDYDKQSEDFETFGNCRGLIKYLENVLNS